MALNNKENKVKPKNNQSDKIVKPVPSKALCERSRTVEGILYGKTAFTIIELLTVMSIIIILIGLLVPSLNMAKRYAKEVRQKAQFHSIDSALELFSGAWDGYPPSSAMDGAATPAPYCGAMKLCEALVGQDLMGFHPESRFRADCTIDGTKYLYDNPNPPGQVLYPDVPTNLKSRQTYLQQTSDVYKLEELYATITPFTNVKLNVLCDVYSSVKHRVTGKSIGRPILYYKANTSNIIHDPCLGITPVPTRTSSGDYIYNYYDNDDIVHLASVQSGTTHPLDGGATPRTNFYEITRDKRISLQSNGNGRPYRPDSYILISAGFDGIYGTNDDIFNFEK
jgi:type II secretory pathway pseudopilin PulG